MSEAIEKAEAELQVAMHRGNIADEVASISNLIRSHLATHKPSRPTGDEFFAAVQQALWIDADELFAFRQTITALVATERNRRAAQ